MKQPPVSFISIVVFNIKPGNQNFRNRTNHYQLKRPMMSAEYLILCDAIAEKFRCSICKGYMCSPIRVSSEGQRSCGRCPPQNPDESTTGDSVLETILNAISFPCRFRKEGCTERSLFGRIVYHEVKCYYRSIASCLETDCTWRGTALTFFDYVNEKRRARLQEKAEINLELAETSHKSIFFKEGSTTFHIRYFYKCETRELSYGTSYKSYDNGIDVAFKITIMNGSDSITLNQIHFVSSFYKQAVLDLNKFCEFLNNPDSIVIVFNFTVTQVNSIVQKLDLPTCNKCYNYLIPPLFMLEDKLVCYECGERDNAASTSPNNEELSQLLKQIDFPCHWRNCSFSGKSDVYKTHQASCKFYWHKCFILNCEHYFSLYNAIDHYTSFHNAEYFVGNIMQNISFSGECYCEYKHTMKNDVYILFEHELRMIDKPRNKILSHSWKLHSTNPESITASVFLHHEHCRRTAEPMQLSSEKALNITSFDLPPCFKKNEDILVTITIE